MTIGKRQGAQRANRRPRLSRIVQAVTLETLEDRRMLNGDFTPPTAFLEAPPVNAGGATSHIFTIRYIDDVAMGDATVDGDEVKITGPSNYNPVVSLKTKQTLPDGSILATYEFIPPGGKWDSTDNSLSGYTVEILQGKVADAAGNPVPSGVLGSIVVNIETTPPVATLKTSPLPNPVAGTEKYTFVVIYSDNVALDTTTFGGAESDLTISKTGFTADAVYVSHVPGTAANSYEVTYEFTAPGGTWNAADNGAYTITKRPNAVRDVNGNSVTSGTLTTLSVNLADIDPPTATLSAPAFNATGNGKYQFTVLYNDDVGLDTISFGTGDIVVTRPGGFSQIAAYVINELGTGNERRVIYEVSPPGGTWDSTDNGIYSIRVVAGEVKDNTGNAAPAGVLGTFTVAIPPVDNSIPQMSFIAADYQPLGQMLTVVVNYTDPQGMNSAYLPLSKLLVTGPGGRIIPMSYLSGDDGSVNPFLRQVTYVGIAPGGVWDPSDAGEYTVRADPDFAAVDTGNNPVDATLSAGTFNVAVSIEPIAVDAGGNLVIYGTDNSDVITLNIVNNMLRVAVNQTTRDFTQPLVKTITIHGLAGDDSISVGPGIMGVAIHGGDGNDTLVGGDGNDSLYGGNGNDVLYGGAGNDYLHGGDGNDTLFGGAGNDTLDGGLGADVMSGGPGIDTVDYSSRSAPLRISIDGAANDGETGEGDNVMLDVENVWGGAGNDYIVGSAGANFLFGGPGNDTLKGGAGNDTLDGGPGADVMYGGPGEDTVTYASRRAPIRASIDNKADDGEVGEFDNIITDVENIIGGFGNDLLIGSRFNNKLWGGPGNDTLRGGAGNDTLVGGPGRDFLYGEAGNDRIYAGDGARDVIVGGAGRDTVEADATDRVSEVEVILKPKKKVLR